MPSFPHIRGDAPWAYNQSWYRTQLAREMTVGPDRPRRVVGCGKTLRERLQVRIDAGLRIIGHDRGAPWCWSSEDRIMSAARELKIPGMAARTRRAQCSTKPIK